MNGAIRLNPHVCSNGSIYFNLDKPEPVNSQVSKNNRVIYLRTRFSLKTRFSGFGTFLGLVLLSVISTCMKVSCRCHLGPNMHEKLIRSRIWIIIMASNQAPNAKGFRVYVYIYIYM